MIKFFLVVCVFIYCTDNTCCQTLKGADTSFVGLKPAQGSHTIYRLDSVKVKYPYLMVSLNVGYSRMLGNINNTISPDLRWYVEALESGISLSGDIHYYYSDKRGLGIKYDFFYTSNETNNVPVIFPNKPVKTGVVSDKIYLNYIGPSFTRRFLSKDNERVFYIAVSLGRLFYSNDSYTVEPFQKKANILGAYYELGYDTGLSKYLAFGIKLSYLYTGASWVLEDKNIPVNSIVTDRMYYLGFDHLDVSAGLRFKLSKS